MFGKDSKIIIAIVGKNCDVEQRSSALTNKLLIGCSRLKFHLAVVRWIDEQSGVLGALLGVCTLMSNLENLKIAAQVPELI